MDETMKSVSFWVDFLSFPSFSCVLLFLIGTVEAVTDRQALEEAHTTAPPRGSGLVVERLPAVLFAKPPSRRSVASVWRCSVRLER
jgi:hypothetical protein